MIANSLEDYIMVGSHSKSQSQHHTLPIERVALFKLKETISINLHMERNLSSFRYQRTIGQIHYYFVWCDLRHDGPTGNLISPLERPCSLFSRMRILASGQVLEDIDMQEKAHEQFSIFSVQMASLFILLGIRYIQIQNSLANIKEVFHLLS